MVKPRTQKGVWRIAVTGGGGGGGSCLNFGDEPASSLSKFSVGMNSDLGNGSFCVEIRDAKHVNVVEDLQEFGGIN